MTLSSSVLNGAKIGSVSNGISNMVVTTLNYLIDNRTLNGSADDIFISGLSGVISGGISGGLAGGYLHVKVQLKFSDLVFLKEDGNVDWSYAPNDGRVPGTVQENQPLPKGTIIDRYGSKYDKYTSPVGTPFDARALPYENNGWVYHKYKLVNDINDIISSEIAPAFNKPGGGNQFELPGTIKDIAKAGY